MRAWRGYILLSLAWLAILGAALWVARRPAAQPIEILPPPTSAPTAAPTPTPTPGPLRVDVAGAVLAPGVYALPPGSIIADAIEAAGGPTEEADLDRLNKALALRDGVQVYVPYRGAPDRVLVVEPEPEPASAGSPQRNAPGPGLIDLNRATPEELESLPGIGPVLAGKIIEGRPYRTVEELLRVKGIGPATFAKLRELVTVE